MKLPQQGESEVYAEKNRIVHPVKKICLCSQCSLFAYFTAYIRRVLPVRFGDDPNFETASSQKTLLAMTIRDFFNNLLLKGQKIT